MGLFVELYFLFTFITLLLLSLASGKIQSHMDYYVQHNIKNRHTCEIPCHAPARGIHGNRIKVTRWSILIREFYLSLWTANAPQDFWQKGQIFINRFLFKLKSIIIINPVKWKMKLEISGNSEIPNLGHLEVLSLGILGAIWPVPCWCSVMPTKPNITNIKYEHCTFWTLKLQFSLTPQICAYWSAIFCFYL